MLNRFLSAIRQGRRRRDSTRFGLGSRNEHLVASRSAESLAEELINAKEEIERLENELRIKTLEIEVHRREAELLAFVVARDRERLAAEIAIYINTKMQGEMPHNTPAANHAVVDELRRQHAARLDQ